MKTIHHKNNYLSKENFHFLKQFLHEKNIIQNKELNDVYELYD